MKLTTAAALGAAIALTVSAPAYAIASNVEVGGSGSAGEHPVTARSNNAVQIAMEKVDGTFLTLGCSSVTVPRAPETVARSGNGVVRVLTFEDMVFEGCSGFIFANPTTLAPSSVERTGGAVTNGGDDRWPGRIDDVHLLHKSIYCEFEVTGRAAASFDEASQVLRIQENATRPVGLTMSVAKGCGGQLKQGGAVKLNAPLKVASADGPINAVP